MINYKKKRENFLCNHVVLDMYFFPYFVKHKKLDKEKRIKLLSKRHAVYGLIHLVQSY